MSLEVQTSEEFTNGVGVQVRVNGPGRFVQKRESFAQLQYSFLHLDDRGSQSRFKAMRIFITSTSSSSTGVTSLVDDLMHAPKEASKGSVAKSRSERVSSSGSAISSI